MGLYDIVAAAQGGRCFYNLGRRLQVDETRAAATAWHLMRALRPSFESWLGRPGGGYLLLDCLGRDGFDTLLGETQSFTDGRIRDRGYRLVSEWIASAPLDVAELDRASVASGLPREMLMRSLPWIAALEMGALQRAADKPLRAILSRMRGKRFAEHAASPALALALIEALSEAERERGTAALSWTLESLVGRLKGGAAQGQAVRA